MTHPDWVLIRFSYVDFGPICPKFLQPVNLAMLTIWCLFNPLAVPASHLLSPFLAHQPSLHWKSQIAYSDMHHPDSGINSRFIPSASPVMSRLTSSFTCRLISIIITTLIIHHYLTLSLQAQNPHFQQILPTWILLLPLDYLYDHGTGVIMLVDLFSVRFFVNFSVCPMWWTKLTTAR